jgi:hypothetical protein
LIAKLNLPSTSGFGLTAREPSSGLPDPLPRAIEADEIEARLRQLEQANGIAEE